VATLATAQPQPRYTVIDLGTLGGTYSGAFGINNSGYVAGAAATSAQTDGFAATAYLWTRQSGMLDLGTLGPPSFPVCPTCNSGAAAVGASGQVAMGSEIATLDPNGEDFGQWQPFSPTHRITRGAIWRNGVKTVLSNLPGGNNNNPFWMNNLGQVSGLAETDVYDPTCSTVTPFQVRRYKGVVWGPDAQIERRLEPLQPGWVSYAFTINDNGDVVGASGPCATTGMPPFAINNTVATRAVMWDRDGSITDLGDLGGAKNIAGSINNRGEVAGSAQSPKDGTIHTFLWTRQTKIQDYGAFPGAIATFPGCCHTINDSGQIVGTALFPDFSTRALIWVGKQPNDLNNFVQGRSPFVQLVGAFSINDAGEIACGGITPTGELHACLAIPNHSEGSR
jgi:probable HAF family extracellular repeat protein